MRVDTIRAVLRRLRTDPNLLGLEGGDVDHSGVVAVEELAPLVLCLGEIAGEELSLGRVAVLTGSDLGPQLLAQTSGP
ncbi:MAG: hypothetical protein ACRDVP_02625 [Acidimicrobiales bacterium]